MARFIFSSGFSDKRKISLPASVIFKLPCLIGLALIFNYGDRITLFLPERRHKKAGYALVLTDFKINFIIFKELAKISRQAATLRRRVIPAAF
ncbi:hypothetical protein [Erwinia sp. CGal63]|uniref:hypothetical protein n=1 Tax=Erwinia sp. CGal63 TaxID=2919889 RepID=UPI00300AF1CC